LHSVSRRGSVAGAILIVIAPAVSAQDARPATSAPATSTRATEARTIRIELPGGGFYWLRAPAGYRPGELAPLALCLHGTDEAALEAMTFWAACRPQWEAVWAAPQALGRGWCEADLPRLRQVWADLQRRITFDPERVLLAGFSAGGAMAFHWLYREGFPATAVVTLANYLPPAVTPDEVSRRRHIPVFYGVGTEDINHERMRRGLALLREQGVHVRLVRPPIGHTLSPVVGREAVAWFEELCRDATRRQLDEAAEALRRDPPAASGRAAAQAERILAQARWHDAENVRQAEALLAEAMAWGREQLARADRLAATDRRAGAGSAAEALAILREIEAAYAGASLAEQARARRLALEADPSVRQAAAQRQRRCREEEAMALYLDVQRLVATGRFEEARQTCEVIANVYADTPAADHARALLPKLPGPITR